MRAIRAVRVFVLNIKRIRGLLAAALVLAALPGAALAAEIRELVPMGSAVGIELKTPGAVVVGLEEPSGEANAPSAAEAGVLPGDLIIKLGASDISSSEDFIDAASKMDGGQISLTVVRNDKKMQFTLTPHKSEDGFKLGIWIRDGVTGIGTLTFCDPQTGLYGALGHPINDADTGIIMPLGNGSIMDATIVSVNPGKSGEPGELRGVFDINNACGSILRNSFAGIFGKSTKIDLDQLPPAVPLAAESDINVGRASILSCISGNETKEYEIEITKIFHGSGSGRDLLIEIIDAALLESTGGIVQGMSGSPIIQEGKLVGAVTHVLVNDPSKGYGIFIETMLDEGREAIEKSLAA